VYCDTKAQIFKGTVHILNGRKPSFHALISLCSGYMAVDITSVDQHGLEAPLDVLQEQRLFITSSNSGYLRRRFFKFASKAVS
jgi:hypothetical protein